MQTSLLTDFLQPWPIQSILCNVARVIFISLFDKVCFLLKSSWHFIPLKTFSKFLKLTSASLPTWLTLSSLAPALIIPVVNIMLHALSHLLICARCLPTWNNVVPSLFLLPFHQANFYSSFMLKLRHLP